MIQKKLKIYHSISTMNSLDGGLSKAVLGMLDNPKKYMSIISKKKNTDFSYLSKKFKGEKILQNEISFFFSKKLMKSINYNNKNEIIIHSHGIWRPYNNLICNFAYKNNIPYIIQPHGMLEPWSLNQKSFKKKIALKLFQLRNLSNAEAFVATSKMEYKNLRKLKIKKPIAIIPNGIFNPPKIKKKKNNKVIQILFLSRIHPKKGILNLLNVLSKIKLNNWHLRIVGTGEKKYLNFILKKIRNLKIEKKVTYVGPLDDKKKYNEYFKSDIFVLPSFSENFGLVVPEALSCGLPVITSNKTPWKDLDKFKCGWCIPNNDESLKKVLIKFLNLKKDKRQKLSKNAKSFSKNFFWKKIHKKFDVLYYWLLTKRKKPNFVYLK
ncbi:glycosyltransferase [Candidatus Pelagibacter communis]|uniref:glycosyltransferase n=1 Tax=Pelagibacter ubique TaxID=198252 RepID=UPI00094D646D|nr:glycosyltransferase [Candidatus Pelagibacter ubique]